MAFFLFIFLILLLLYSFLIEFYRQSWNAISFPLSAWDNTKPDVMISVIIAVRNEEHHIKNLVRELSAQDYPKNLFEVIIIDDHSSDSTWLLMLETFVKDLKVTNLQLTGSASGKKKAIETGINAAIGQLIITTDADCSWPTTWISTIAAHYQASGAKFIAAPVMMNPSKSFSGIFQTLDFLVLQGITGASVYKRFHAMCNGANLAYERQVFFEVNGFEGIDDIPSGDDMLLMQKIFTKYPENVAYLKSKPAIVETLPESSWKAFLNQRIRWASKASHYKDKKIFFALLLTYLVNVGFLVLGIASIVNTYWFTFLALFLLMKILIEFPFVNSIAIFFNQKRLMKYFPLLQPVHILYIIIAGWLGRFGSYEWKSRIIKNKGKTNLAKQ